MDHGSFAQRVPRKSFHDIISVLTCPVFSSALIPTNIYHYAARTGTFVMLVLGQMSPVTFSPHCELGEAVLALLTPTLLSTTSVYAFTLLGTVLIFILALLVRCASF
jgi:hypothetical protein